MIRSISYSRYFRIPTPIDTGSAATPNHAKPVSTPKSVGPLLLLLPEPAVPATIRQTTLTKAPLASHLSCWRRSPVAPPAQRLADDETQRQPEYQEDDQALDGVEPADRMIDGRQPAAFVDADGMGGQRAGDRHGGSDQQGREGHAVDAEHPAPEARKPAVREEQDRDREHHEAGTPDLVQRHRHRG